MKYTLSYHDDSLLDKAKDIVHQFNLEINDTFLPRLHLNHQGLSLLNTDEAVVALDWNDCKWRRLAKGAFGSLPLVRACLAGQKVNVLDISAGFGKDALLLAYAGAKVDLVERNSLVAALLFDAFERFNHPVIKAKMRVFFSEAATYLENLKEYPDVVFFDPMHPERQKSALVKKNLQCLQQIIPPNDDVLDLIHLAQKKCQTRLVVKWPAKIKTVTPPDFSLSGKTIRYDIYLASSNLNR